MITKITLQNFKGIGEEPVEIPIRPLTLLFGANSSGKSTIFHAIAYAREILLNGNVDVEYTELCGDAVDLGGFHEIVHKHDDSQKIRLRFDLDLSRVSFVDFYSVDDFLIDRNGAKTDISDMGTDVMSAWIELLIGFPDIAVDAKVNHPLVLAYRVGLNEQFLATLAFTPRQYFSQKGNFPTTSYAGTLQQLNLSHPIFLPNNKDSDNRFSGVIDEILPAFRDIDELDQRDEEFDVSISFATGTELDEFLALPIAFLPLQSSALPIFEKRFLFHFLNDNEFSQGVGISERRFVEQILARLIYGPSQILRDSLETQFRYIGPIRKTPERDYHMIRHSTSGRWANGLGAWDALIDQSNEIEDELSKWLENTDNLNTGYRLDIDDVREIPQAVQEKLIRFEYDDENQEEIQQLDSELGRFPKKRSIYLLDIAKNTRLHPHSVGIGLSQVIPVIAAILAKGASTCMIEQPELHLHPMQQAALGDLMIQGVKWYNKTIIAETHSIHMVLRILRRIRQTYNKEQNVDNPFTRDELVVLFVDSENGASTIMKIGVAEDGDLLQPWPDNFFDQEFQERFQ